MRCKIVIADDHALMLIAIRMALGNAHRHGDRGRDGGGQQLLPLVGRTSPDVVLLDLWMPGMDGLRCLELLRERYPKVKTIVLSANDDPAAVEASLARGAIAFIQKTVDPTDLAAVVRQAIAGNVFSAFGRGQPPRQRRLGPDAARARDPARAGRGQVEQGDARSSGSRRRRSSTT